MKRELFIDQDLRTLQKKLKNNKSSENLVMRSGNHNKCGEIKDFIPKGNQKISEKIASEKTSEKIASEKTSEKIASEKKLEVVSTELLQTLFGVKPQIKSNNNRLF